MKENKYYYKDGTTSSEYYSSKALHRTDGPAIEWADGDKVWYVNGKCHRVDGPAAEMADGQHWYVDGERYTEEKFNELITEVKELPLALKLTDPREWVRKIVF